MSAHSDVLDGPIPDSEDAKLRLVEELKNRGRAAVGAKSWRDASLLYKRAVQVSPNDAVLYANLALTLINMGLYEEARGNAVKSTELDATYVKGFWRLGQALDKLKRTSEALDAMKQALELDPNNKALKKEVERLTQQLKEEEELMKMDIDTEATEGDKMKIDLPPVVKPPKNTTTTPPQRSLFLLLLKRWWRMVVMTRIIYLQSQITSRDTKSSMAKRHLTFIGNCPRRKKT